MVRLANVDLPQQALKELRGFQQRVDAGRTYVEKVTLAKRLFSQQNRLGSRTFNAVKQSLTKMCSGARRCCYCEDSVADEIEHIKPKNIYPELVFVWENYLYACGPCNGPKNNRFAVFTVDDGRVVSVGRAPKAPVIAPTGGEPLLIDPRQEDPLDYMELDLLGTFVFLPLGDPGSQHYQRADYTIELLGLNRRDYLLRARAQAYRSYRAHLVEYLHRRNTGVAQAELDDLIIAIRRLGHSTVWHEMKRQHDLVPDLIPLFEQMPEAAGW